MASNGLSQLNLTLDDQTINCSIWNQSDGGACLPLYNNHGSPFSNGGKRGNMANIPQIGETHKYVLLIFYLLTFIIGFTGNSLVIYIIARYSEVRKRSVANFYILNLAVADELFVMALPLYCHASWTNNWVFADPLCKIMTVLRESNKFAGIFTLAALSLDRYLASFHTLGALRTLNVGKGVCVAIWIASIAMCSPYLLYSHTRQSGNGHNRCVINWPIHNQLFHLRLWTYSQLAIGLAIPFIIISLSYVLLVRRLKAITKPRMSQRIRRPNNKLTKTVLVVVISFLVCQLPYYIMDIHNLHKRERVEEFRSNHPGEMIPIDPVEMIRHIYLITFSQILLFISSCINPILYGIFNENFRKYFILYDINSTVLVFAHHLD